MENSGTIHGNILKVYTENYTIKMDSILRNVISVELLQATIPNSDYLINDRKYLTVIATGDNKTDELQMKLHL